MIVAVYPTAADIGGWLRRRCCDYELLLDADANDGYVRDWQAPVMSPERHLAYAGQWLVFGLGSIVAGGRGRALGAREARVRRGPGREALRARAVARRAPSSGRSSRHCCSTICRPIFDWLPRLPGSRQLLEPPLAAPSAWLPAPARARRYPWFLIYAKMTSCDRPCSAALERLRQVDAALAGDADRVQRVYWYAGAAPEIAADPELLLHKIDDAAGENTVRALGLDRLQIGRLYVADPRGNLVVSYPADVEQKELLRDLKRLLSASGSN